MYFSPTWAVVVKTGEKEVSEYIWETFDSLFKTVHRQGRRVDELEARIAALEEQLKEGLAETTARRTTDEMPVERAA
jgi:hypothetical protein